MQPWRPPFPVWNQSVAPCPVLTVPSCPAYRFLRRQVRWSGIPISSRIFQFWSTQRLLHSQWSRSRFFLIPLLFLLHRLCSSKSSLLILHNSVNIAYFVLFVWLCFNHLIIIPQVIFYAIALFPNSVQLAETEQDPAGTFLGRNPSHCIPPFLFVENVQPPKLSPKIQRTNLFREVRKCRHKGKQSSKRKEW